MTTTRRRFLASSGFVLGALVHRRGLATSAEAQETKQELVIAQVSSDAGTLDPMHMTQMQDFPMAEMVFSGLVKYGYESQQLTFEPDIAKSWEISKDLLHWKFHLREGVQWHKGYGDVTADDVVFSLQRAMQNSIYTGQYKRFVKDARAQDRHTVVVDLNEPSPFFLSLVMNYGGGFILCKRAVREIFGEAAIKNLDFRLGIDAKHMVGSGPFVYQEHVPGQAAVLVANPRYFRGEPLTKRVTIRYLPNFKTRDFALRSGDVHLMPGARLADWAADVTKAGFKVDINSPVSFYLLWMNQNVKPLDDLRVRRAIAHACNRNEVAAIFGGKVLGAQPARSPLPTSAEGYTADGVPQYEFDPAKARELLAQAGHPNGFRLSAFVSEREVYRRPMELLQANFRDVGITLDLKVIGHSDYHAKNRQGVNPVVLLGSSFPLGQTILEQSFTTDAVPTKATGALNYAMRGDATVDAKIRQVSMTSDAARRKPLYAEIQKLLMEKLIAMPIVEGGFPLVRSSRVDLGYQHRFSVVYMYHITEKTRLLPEKK